MKILTNRMASSQPLPSDPEQLDKLYNETLDNHQAYLNKVREAFDKQMAAIKSDTENKLKTAGANDPKTRQQILKEEKQVLDKLVAELKQTVAKSGKETFARLEEIERKREESALVL